GTAEDQEDDVSALSFAWDFDGDGFYEGGTDVLEPPVETYTQAGIYGVKFRVTDSGGSSDVDTVPVLATSPQDGLNQAPNAQLLVDKASGNAPLTVQFDASASLDQDGEIVEYAWDWNGDGIYDGF